ncbi:hypothetical protein HH214_08825 [Mucilaginibacter robiniae]|uniref:Secreted protein n=1 Tax=Mucilaginibacter robiniae TaxID=2728022 RepID=A0A7L5DXY5_9SPHI|nr:hypothetical protein [Mucilaginibacter robiniae]QJD95972.1 hypothetical protein HH214_08825 [Mucilaginibacter robiniae]
MKKIKLNFALAAMLAGATAAFAFTPARHANTNWYFNGSAGQEQSASAWSTTTVPDDCAPSGTLPCEISVNASNQTQLQSFLSSHTVAQIDAMSAEKRP